ncbi:MAG: YlxR family protein [Clostridia bacterium]|nr:YlxR family protein [Clostridia bacterium]
MQTKKTPMRMCVACRQMKPKTELIRIVKTPEGDIKPFAGNKVNGRGAYICGDVACINKAAKSGALSRALGVDVGEEVYEDLKKGCEERDG